MEDYFGNDPTYVYYGIRADEQRVGYIATKGKNIMPVYPLIELGITVDDVYTKLNAIGLLPPAYFWDKLYSLVALEVGQQTTDTLPALLQRQLFAWRTRSNCYFCFFQRQYEWVGLLEHYPELFEKAEWLENNVGASGYTWVKGRSLQDIRDRKDEIIAKRAKSIINWLNKNSDVLEDDEADYSSILATVSCGLFCGK